LRPQFGDSLSFPGGSQTFNDIIDLTVGSITFTGAAGQSNPRIYGQTIGLAGGITNLVKIGEARVDMNIKIGGGGGPVYFVVNGGGPLRVNGQLSSVSPVVPIRKLGPGVLMLTANNTHSGLTYVHDGILAVSYDAALGSNGPSDGTQVLNGGTLQLLPGVTITEPITLSGTGFGGTNGSLMATGTVTVSSSLVLNNAAALNVGFNSLLLCDGSISGTGPLTKTGLGRLIFAGASANTYSGDTIVNGGTLELTKSVAVASVPGNLVVGPETAGGFYVVARINQNSAIGGTVVTVNEKGQFDLNGYSETLGQLILNDGGLVQTGTGSLRFGRGASVQVGSLLAAGSSASSSISGRLQLTTNASVTFTVAPYNPSAPGGLPAELEVPAVIASDFDRLGEARSRITKQGPGKMRLTANNSAFTGGVTVSAGTLIVANALALGTTTDSTSVNIGGSLALEGGIIINNEGLSLSGTSISALENLSGANAWNGSIFVSANGGIGVSGGTLQLLGLVQGGGSLTKSGPGTLVIGGTVNNTHNGNTYVNEGTVQLAKSAFIQAVPHDLIIGPNARVTYLNHDQVWANITVNAGAVLDLNGFDEYAGLLTLNHGGSVQTGNGTLICL
jgi:autotransporter-associated beta strand protein